VSCQDSTVSFSSFIYSAGLFHSLSYTMPTFQHLQFLVGFMVMFNRRTAGGGERMLILRCLENGPSGLPLCQKSHTLTYIHTNFLKNNSPTQPNDTAATHKQRWRSHPGQEPKCLQFSAGCRRPDTRRGASVRWRTIYISPLPLWLPPLLSSAVQTGEAFQLLSVVCYLLVLQL